jgi:glucosamine kinase
MILIADSGSTKTDWRLVGENKSIHQFSTAGFNPLFQSTEDISREIREKLVPAIKQSGTAIPGAGSGIFFYGASCSSEDRNKIVRDAIAENFPGATIDVEHDLLGAARAVCGHSEGIAAILGTGSNSCFYDGKEIIDNIPSLGFILGDEGSGARLGMALVHGYFYREMPAAMAKRFEERFNITKEDVLEAVYKKPLPSRYLASFSKFIFQNLKERYMVDLVANCFRQFFDAQVSKYERYREVPVNVVGSVGFYYSNILRAVAQEKGIAMGRILETPIASLTLFHTGEE